MNDKRTSNPTEPSVSDNNVDKIREILFGGQMKDYEGRFKRLEEKLNADAERLAQEIDDRINTLEKFLRKELDIKTDQLDQERKLRLDGLKSLEQALQQVEERITARQESAEGDARQSLSETRQEFHDEIAILQTRLREQQESLNRTIEQESEQLRADKVSLSALSGMFGDLSMRLSGELELPEKQD